MLGAAGCSTAVTPGYTVDTYPYDAYYATSVPYVGVYGDPWGTVVYAYAAVDATTGGSAGSGGTTADAGRSANESTVLVAIDSAAQNSMDVCAGHANFQAKQGSVPCGSSDGMSGAQAGYTLRFMGCQLANGGTLDGTIDVSRTVAASDDACSSSTQLTVDFSTKITDLTYLAPNGQKVVINNLDNSGSYSHAVGAPPSEIMSQLNAEISRYDVNANLTSDRMLSGSLDYKLSGSPLTVSISADLSVSNSTGDAGMGMIAISDLRRDTTCCYPTAGTVTITGPERNTFTFGPTCGAVKQNGNDVKLSQCL